MRLPSLSLAERIESLSSRRCLHSLRVSATQENNLCKAIHNLFYEQYNIMESHIYNLLSYQDFMQIKLSIILLSI